MHVVHYGLTWGVPQTPLNQPRGFEGRHHTRTPSDTSDPLRGGPLFAPCPRKQPLSSESKGFGQAKRVRESESQF